MDLRNRALLGNYYVQRYMILDERIWTMPQRTGRPYKAVGNDYF